jgi:hypothetical protein
MRRTLILLPGLALLASACQHSASYDDAYAKCDAAATEAQEAAQPQPDQVATWREGYIRSCMEREGFSS